MRLSLQKISFRHQDGTLSEAIAGVFMLEEKDLYPQFTPLVADRKSTQTPASPEAVSAVTADTSAGTDATADTTPAGAAADATPAGADVAAGGSATDAAAAATTAAVAPELLTSAVVRPRSLASLQLRAKNAMRALLKHRQERMLVLCSSSSIDSINTAVDLVREVGGPEPTVAYAPTKFELFGNDKEDGLVTACPEHKLNVVVMPCVHLIDHPKWLGMLEACLGQNPALKLVLTGDATDVAQLSIIWPMADNALHTDIVLEFSAVGALNTVAGLISYYAQQNNASLAEQSPAELGLAGLAEPNSGESLAASVSASGAGAVDSAAIRVEQSSRDEVLPLLPFDSEALTLLATYCCRLSGDRRYLGLPECAVQALIFEANSYACHAGAKLVQRYHVLKALGANDFRNNFLSESSLREHRDRQLLISTRGAVVGQINGLSVIETLGTSYEYGEPVRITATLRAGGEGDVIDIERKAELAGQIHAKAMMIINGFLTKEFGAEQPLPVSASLVFEQSYSEVDGDSASLTGLCAVISVLAGVPIRQDLAVTGAVDQFGDVQAVGGVNEKIEGFYRVCRLHGFTGTQGVIIPSSCVQQLVLRPAVVKAVAAGKFHIFTVNHVTEAVKLLTTLDWGDSDTEGTICYRICERLNNIVANNNEGPWYSVWWQKLKDFFSPKDRAKDDKDAKGHKKEHHPAHPAHPEHLPHKE